MDDHRFIGSEHREPTIPQRISNQHTPGEDEMHILTATGARFGDRSPEKARIADAMLETMYAEVAKQNGISISDAKTMCDGCSIQMVVTLFERMMVHSHSTTEEAIQSMEFLEMMFSDLAGRIHNTDRSLRRKQQIIEQFVDVEMIDIGDLHIIRIG